MYFFLMTNYSNYVALDEALVLLDGLKKVIAKIRKRSSILESAVI